MDVSRVEVIGFDMDGTLFNSFSVSYGAMKEGFAAFWKEMDFDGPTPSWDKIKNLIGLPSYEFFPAALPESHREHWKLLHKMIGDAESRRLDEGRGRCFDGTHETLGELTRRGYELRCLTNASRRYFESVLEGCGLGKYFSEACFLGEDPHRHKVDVLTEWACETVRGGLVYVGDRTGDVDAAHRAGAIAVGVTWGYGSRAELARADLLVDTMPDLLEIFPEK